MSLLNLQNVSANYGGKMVLHEISLSLCQGQSIGLLGPNGSGKSTLLKAMTKTIPFSGRITLSKTDLNQISYRNLAQQIAFVPQEEAAPFPFLVRDVIALGRLAKSSGFADTEEDRRIVDDAAAEADCAELLDRRINELSGGERQRVLIARALAQQAPILLLDEPTSHLDIRHQLATRELIRRLSRDSRAIVVAIHDLNLASSMVEEVIVLDKGRIALQGDLATVFADRKLDEIYGVDFIRTEIDSQIFLVPNQRTSPTK